MHLPLSNNTVRVRLVDTTTVMTVKAECLVSPTQPGHEIISLTDAAFLIEHEPSSQKLMFDLGCRRDYWILPPSVQQVFGSAIPGLRVDRDVSQVLVERGVALESINAVVWSHYHWDHTGDVSVFPPSTCVIVGPGFRAAPGLLPGYPELLSSPILSSDLADRSVVEIAFTTPSILDIGGFGAYDFFGDGSFYLLDCPGHCVGHMCALARTTGDSTDENMNTFIFLGGDICHYSGTFRPNTTNTFPIPSVCPCSISISNHPRVLGSKDVASITPWYQISDHPESGYVDPVVARQSVSRMQRFDEDERVFVCIAHDRAILDVLPTLYAEPEADLNGWREKGWKEACYWGWMRDLPRSDDERSDVPIVEGLWRDGKEVYL